MITCKIEASDLSDAKALVLGAGSLGPRNFAGPGFGGRRQ
jgi:hypothetical protein